VIDGGAALDQPQLLLLRAAVDDGAAGRDAYRAWRTAQDIKALDWPAHHALALLAVRLHGETDPIATQVAHVARMAWLKTQAQLVAARPAVSALRTHDVPVILCDGAAVAHHVGWRVEQRPLDDVAIGVPEAFAQHAAAVLGACGFTSSKPQPDASHNGSCEPRQAWRFKNAGKAVIDVQLTTAPDDVAGTDGELWQQAVPANLCGAECVAASREHALQQALVPRDTAPDHALVWVTDAVLLLRGSDFDWERLAAQAARRHVTDQVAERLGLLRDLVPNLDALEPIERRRSDRVPG
jgi:hypothetical protein